MGFTETGQHVCSGIPEPCGDMVHLETVILNQKQAQGLSNKELEHLAQNALPPGWRVVAAEPAPTPATIGGTPVTVRIKRAKAN